jgi:small subunit ribosomal protein S13
MARVSGVDIPREKRVEVALTYVFGIGRTLSQQTLAETGVNPNTRVRDLSEEELVKIREYVDANIKTEGEPQRNARSPCTIAAAGAERGYEQTPGLSPGAACGAGRRR